MGLNSPKWSDKLLGNHELILTGSYATLFLPLQFKSSTPEMAGHRGRVYKCIRKERSRVSSHVLNTMSPFYCTLCAFRCVTNAQLKRHVVHYEPHVSRARRLGPGACQNVWRLRRSRGDRRARQADRVFWPLGWPDHEGSKRRGPGLTFWARPWSRPARAWV